MANQYILSLVNPGAENGNTSGWTAVSHSGTTPNVSSFTGSVPGLPGPNSGTWYFSMNTSTTQSWSTLTQDVVINDDSANVDIDTGRATINLSYWQASYGETANDLGDISITAMTSNKTVILGGTTSNDRSSIISVDRTSTWHERHVGMVLPANTRWIRVKVFAADRATTGAPNVYFDDISDLYITYGDESASSNVEKLYVEVSTDVEKSNANIIQMFAEVIIGAITPRVMVA